MPERAPSIAEEKSPSCCGCASFPWLMCPPCWRWNFDRGEYWIVEQIKAAHK